VGKNVVKALFIKLKYYYSRVVSIFRLTVK
jgi:hypothetical protein